MDQSILVLIFSLALAQEGPFSGELHALHLGRKRQVRALPVSSASQGPLAQRNKHAKVAGLRVACSEHLPPWASSGDALPLHKEVKEEGTLWKTEVGGTLPGRSRTCISRKCAQCHVRLEVPAEPTVAFLLTEGKGQAWKLDSAIFDPEPDCLDLSVLLCPESQKPQLSLNKGPGTVGDICNSVSCDRKVKTKKERRTQGGGQAWGFRAICQASHKSVLLN